MKTKNCIDVDLRNKIRQRSELPLFQDTYGILNLAAKYPKKRKKIRACHNLDQEYYYLSDPFDTIYEALWERNLR